MHNKTSQRNAIVSVEYAGQPVAMPCQIDLRMMENSPENIPCVAEVRGSDGALVARFAPGLEDQIREEAEGAVMSRAASLVEELNRSLTTGRMAVAAAVRAPQETGTIENSQTTSVRELTRKRWEEEEAKKSMAKEKRGRWFAGMACLAGGFVLASILTNLFHLVGVEEMLENISPIVHILMLAFGASLASLGIHYCLRAAHGPLPGGDEGSKVPGPREGARAGECLPDKQENSRE